MDIGHDPVWARLSYDQGTQQYIIESSQGLFTLELTDQIINAVASLPKHDKRTLTRILRSQREKRAPKLNYAEPVTTPTTEAV